MATESNVKRTSTASRKADAVEVRGGGGKREGGGVGGGGGGGGYGKGGCWGGGRGSGKARTRRMKDKINGK